MSVAQSLRDERLRSLGEFSGQIAHEINGCLAALRLHLVAAGTFGADVATSPGGAAYAPSLHTCLDDATACVDRIAGLVDEIRRFGRPDAARPELLGLDEVASAALRLMGPWIARTARVDVRIEPSAPVMGHRGRLVQVAFNLLRNSIEALETCGRPYEARRIAISTGSDGRDATLCVQDDGPGIPAELLARVFEAHFTTKSPERGSGLGLFIAREIVSAHGGELHLSGVPGGGTRAEIRLPLATRGV